MLLRTLDSTGVGLTTIDQKIAEIFNNNFGLGGDWPWGNLILCFIAIILSVILCGMVGLEREKRGRSAGLRTHLLVGVGSAIIMIISIYGFPAGYSRDVARLAAQVVTGVGFLGAGAIIHNNGGIKGLTTASTIWLVMAIGLACGSMNFVLAIGATIVVMIILVIFRKTERIVTRSNPQFVLLAKSDVPAMTYVLAVAKEHNLTVGDVNTQIVKDGDSSCIELVFKLSSEEKGELPINEIVKELQERTNAVSIQVLNHH